MDRKTREELNALSKAVFGKSSRWQKFVNDGVTEYFERDREVIVPGLRGFTKKVFTDKKGVVKRYTVDEIRKAMQEELANRPKLFVDTKSTTVELPLAGNFESGMSVQGNGLPEGVIVK